MFVVNVQTSEVLVVYLARKASNVLSEAFINLGGLLRVLQIARLLKDRADGGWSATPGGWWRGSTPGSGWWQY